MRLSERFSLHRTQPSLDFVDVDDETDVPFYVDPEALRLLSDDWGDECVALIQDFFKIILHCIRDNNDARAKHLLVNLREPNETHLGLSSGRSQGRALGPYLAGEVYRGLSKSDAIRTGMVRDLHETALVIPGVGPDIVSDITTNIIRGPLITYTQETAIAYGIPLVPDQDSGPLWDVAAKSWHRKYVSLPRGAGRKLLLVPKAIVRSRLQYDRDEYYNDFIIPYLRSQELSANTGLVQLLRDGRRRVTKKSLIEKYGRTKADIVRITLDHPDILDKYRATNRNAPRPPMDHRKIGEVSGNVGSGEEAVDWDGLLGAVLRLQSGRDDSTAHEKAIADLLHALFYPALVHPDLQVRIHDGRKIIDIAYTNVASRGFFWWLGQHYPAPKVYVECKNFDEPANPELDQLAGRFSPSRGRCGLLVCRGLLDRARFRDRCRDTARDGRGWIIGLDDNDLRHLVELRRRGTIDALSGFLHREFEELLK